MREQRVLPRGAALRWLGSYHLGPCFEVGHRAGPPGRRTPDSPKGWCTHRNGHRPGNTQNSVPSRSASSTLAIDRARVRWRRVTLARQSNDRWAEQPSERTATLGWTSSRKALSKTHYRPGDENVTRRAPVVRCRDGWVR